MTSETRGLLGEKQLRLMKPTAVLVNLSRAQIIDEDALYRALAERTIGGAALDVWYRYHDRTILTSTPRWEELPW